MNLSGIAVLASPQNVGAVAQALATLPGVQVARVEADCGRIVLVQEAADIATEVDGFRAIVHTAGVIKADLVCHYFGDQPIPEPDPARILARLEPDFRDPAQQSCAGAVRNDLNDRGIQ